MASIIKMFLLFAFFMTITAAVLSAAPVDEELYVRLNQSSAMFCLLEANTNESTYWWEKIGDHTTKENINLTSLTTVEHSNATHFNIALRLHNITRKDNGTYRCRMKELARDNYRTQVDVHLMVLEQPEITPGIIKPVMENNEPNLTYVDQEGIKSTNFSHLLNVGKLKRGGTYNFTIEVSYSGYHWSTARYPQSITLLEEDFVPEVSVEKTTKDSITIVWTKPATNQEYFIYNILENQKTNTTTEPYWVSTKLNRTTIKDLDSDTSYFYKVNSCSIFNFDLCGDWSNEVEGHTKSSAGTFTQYINSTIKTMKIIVFTFRYLVFKL